MKQTLGALKEVTVGQDSYAVFTPTCITWLLDGNNEAKFRRITTDSVKETLKAQIINRLYEIPAEVTEVYTTSTTLMLFILAVLHGAMYDGKLSGA